MWWFRSLLTLCLCLVLTGCFRPMYGGLQGAQLQQQLASIEFEPVPDRFGHYLTNALRYELRLGSRPPAPRYHLSLIPHMVTKTALVDSISGRPTGAAYVADVYYKLVETGSNATITEGVAFETVSYDRMNLGYGDTQALLDAETRTAKALAAQIKTRLAAALDK